MTHQEQPSEPVKPTPDQLKQANRIAWVIVALLLSPIAACGAIGFFSSSSDNCYEQAGQNILRRDGNKVLNSSDIERYQREIRSRCN